MANDVTKSFFAVFNNPESHGYEGSPAEICERLRDEWIGDSETRTGAWAYCISAEGLEHVHMVLEDRKAMRFTAIKAEYAVGTHFEVTKGSKEQAEAYIEKRPPYDEKDEKVVCVVRHGEIQGRQGKRSDLNMIEELLDAGMIPDQIFAENFTWRRYERMVRAEFMARCKRQTPVVRNVAVHYITGESGTGKSFIYVDLCKAYGEEKIYRVSDYTTGGFDMYTGEPILFMDEYKGQLSYASFLNLLDRYRTQVHARYANVYSCWSDVYITSVFPPEVAYQKMVGREDRGIDSLEQLLRRITDITYCYRDPFGNYCKCTIPTNEYKGYDSLKQLASQIVDGDLKDYLHVADS